MSKNSIKAYKIGGTTYEQRPLVFGQWQQLNRIMDGVIVPAALTPRNLVGAIGDSLDMILAVILTEEGKSPQDKNLSDLAKHLAFAMSPEEVAEVVTDFFSCNPIASVLNLVVGVTEKITATMNQAAGSSEPSSSSAMETGPSETTSSGDVLQ